jgi:hypothetical protein
MTMAEPALADGQKYSVRERIEAVVQIEFFTPSMIERRCTLPVGFQFSIWGIPERDAGSVSVKPVEQERWEPVLVGAREREDSLYGGFTVRIDRTDLLKRCDRVLV